MRGTNSEEAWDSARIRSSFIPWAGATSKRMDVYIEQTNKRLLPLTQVVSAKEAVEDDPDFYDASEMM